ncbi:MAG: hypothetical protein JWL73_249 [Actinomycetia bacterium]|nr:hypothetical protein [Actinomycetes bacterium]
MALLVGTSGWQYRDWRGAFYPRDLPQREWLAHYAAAFPTVELNNSFYRLPERKNFERWAASTPSDFRFAVKASRYLTHIKRLQDPQEPVQRMLDHARGLGRKLDVVLLQLPPTLQCDMQRLEATLASFPGGADRVRVALEVRHPSWCVDPVYDLLRRTGTALCLTDRRNRVSPLVRTADWCYVRLHEGTASPGPSYGRAALRHWAGRIHDLYGSDPDGYVYFNNDPTGAAIRNARTFTRLTAKTAAAAQPG